VANNAELWTRNSELKTFSRELSRKRWAGASGRRLERLLPPCKGQTTVAD
jgi:hypothetical protein